MAIGLKLRNLLYVIHTVPPERVANLMPPGIAVDTRNGPEGPRAFLATVTLESGSAFPYVLSGFRQVNYRIYVRHADEPGVLYVRSWVSARAAAAVMNLAIPTEHASVEIQIDDAPAPYSRYHVWGNSNDYRLELDAQADSSVGFPSFPSREEAVRFLTHRLNGFAAGAHPKSDLSVIRVTHPPMDPIPARVRTAIADQWTSMGVLSSEELSRPLLALIQPEVEFDMKLPEKIHQP